MPRLAGLRPALLALALCLRSPLGACSSHGGGADAGATVAVDTAPVPAPSGHLGDLFLPAPGATWDKMRGVIGAPALFLPQGFGGLVATLVGMPITYAAEDRRRRAAGRRRGAAGAQGPSRSRSAST